MAEVVIGWGLSNPVVASVIVGASRPEQVKANARAAEVKLSADELNEVNALID